MNTLGIVAEYNPFHSGHAYHIKQAKAQTGAERVIVVMSPNYVQRGEPAITDKFTRARKAVLGGADVVFELPFLHTTSSAEQFARGALLTLAETGLVDTISFGSESGNLNELQKQKAFIEERLLDGSFQKDLSQGRSFAASLSGRLKPNDILAIEYLRANEGLALPFQMHTLKRLGDYHAETIGQSFPSATALRKAIRRGYPTDYRPVFYDDMTDMIFSALMTHDLKNIHGMKEGIEHALLRECTRVHTLSELLEAVRTPRFGLARLRRLLLHTLFQITEESYQKLKNQTYLRPLAFSEDGRDILKSLRGKLVLHPSKAPAELKELLALEIMSSNVYYYLQKTENEYKRKAMPCVKSEAWGKSET